jgi:hypothetical protein
MRTVISAFVLVTTMYAGPCWAQSDRSANSETKVLLPEPAMLGAHMARGVKAAKPVKSPNLIYHNGGVAVSGAQVTAIFWGTKWNSASFVGDKITGIDSFYGGVGNTSYVGTNTEYTSTDTGTVANVSAAVTYNGHIVDTSAAPSRAPQTSAILAEVCSKISNPIENGYYPVYIDAPRGHAGYCAWHSWGTCNGVNVQFGFFFNLDGDPGCDPEDSSSGHSQGLAAIGNVSGHELSEELTDPRGSGWYDANGAENADKCAWTFGASLLNFGGKTGQWKIQGNWSNNAYDSNSGYTDPTQGMVRGCIDGTN